MKQWIVKQLEISHGTNTPMRAMEGLRGVAVFLVFLVHYSTLISPWLAESIKPISLFIHSAGHIGVDLFFILSGFLIYGTVINKSHFNALLYGKRRVVRIYPTFLVVLMVYLALSFLFPAESKLPTAIEPLFIYLTQNILLLPGLFNIDPVITVAWSLSYEVFYYLAIPIVIFALKMQLWTSKQRIIIWLLVSMIGFSLFYFYGGPVRLMMFIAGIILFEIHKAQGASLKQFGTSCLILALLLFGSKAFLAINYTFALALVYGLFFVFCLNALSSGSSTNQWLIFAPLRWLGNMSYSYYLIHGLTLKFCFLVFGLLVEQRASYELLYFWLWLPLLAITLISSFVLFILIEKPLSINSHKNKPVTKTC